MGSAHALRLALGLVLIAAGSAAATIVPTWTYHTQAPILSTPKMADLDNDGVSEIVVTTYSTNPGNPYDGGYVHVLQTSGNERPGWPYFSNGSPIPATSAIGDLEGNGQREIVIGSWSRLFVFEPDGSIMSGFPVSVGTSETAALYDLNGDGELEILYPSGNRLYVMDRHGTTLPGWPYAIQASYYIGSPVVGDVNGDGQVEIVAGSYQGPANETPFVVYVWTTDGQVLWTFSTSGVVKACPALGDIDGDGADEVVVVSYDTSENDYLYLLDQNGVLMPGWPQRAGRSRLSPPAIADLDLDGSWEIVVGGAQVGPPYLGQIFAFRDDGTPMPGFPVTLASGGQINDPPIVLDLDGDLTRLEILVKNADHVYGYHSDGTPMADFPFVFSDQGHSGTTSPGPLAGDVDGDGAVELVFCSSYDTVYFFDSFGPFHPDLAFWPTYKHDALNTGNLGFSESPGLAETEPLGARGLRLVCAPNPFHAKTRLSLIGEPAVGPGGLRVYGADGRLLRRLVPAGAQAVEWDGRDDRGRAVPQGTYFVRVAEGGVGKRLVLLR